MNFADAGMIVGQLEFDFSMRKKPEANANLLRNRDLSFAGNLHGITPTSKCNADFDDEQQSRIVQSYQELRRIERMAQGDLPAQSLT
jgi:hypothetical protein